MVNVWGGECLGGERLTIVDNGDKEEEGDETQDGEGHDEGEAYDKLVGVNRPPFCNCNEFTCECSAPSLDSGDDIFADS